MNLCPFLKQRFFDTNGVPLAGGSLYSYQAGTTTPQATYSSASGTPNTNPVVLDASGYADVWLDPTLAYKFVVFDVNGVQQFTVDNVTYAVGITTWNANTVYQQGAIVQDSSGQGILYVSLISSNQNRPLTDVSAWRVYNGNVRTVSSGTTLAITDDFVRSVSTAGALTHTLPAVASTPIGKRITIKDVGTGGYTTSVKGSGTDTIDGNNTFATAVTKNSAYLFTNNGTSWDVALAYAVPSGPAVQTYLSGSGTYTTPTSPAPLYLKVRMVGGGGGGAGSGTSGTSGAGGAGGNTTFGTSLLVANGGGGGAGGSASSGGSGGSASLGTGPVGLALTGGTGGGSFYSNGATASMPGAMGGASPLGGAGAGLRGTAGVAAAANTGSGGGGGGCTGQATDYNGAGGGAGGFVDAIILNPAASYAYAVGAAGTAGTAGTTGYAGGAGALGAIIIEAHYQ